MAIAHRLSSIKNADLIIFLGKDGTIAEMGTWEELCEIKNGKFAKFESVQDKLIKSDIEKVDLVYASHDELKYINPRNGESLSSKKGLTVVAVCSVVRTPLFSRFSHTFDTKFFGKESIRQSITLDQSKLPAETGTLDHALPSKITVSMMRSDCAI